DAKFLDLTTPVSEPEKIVVTLDSPGGLFEPGFRIANAIHLRGMTTMILPNASCHSVCAIIWLGGMERGAYKSGHMAFHGIYDGDTGEVSQGAAVQYAKVGAFLGHVGLSYDAIEWIMSAPSQSAHWLTPETAAQYRIRFVLLDDPHLHQADSQSNAG